MNAVTSRYGVPDLEIRVPRHSGTRLDGASEAAIRARPALPPVPCIADPQRGSSVNSPSDSSFPVGTLTIGKTFDFEAGHRLPSLPPEHKCSHQHGHSYRVEVILTAPALKAPGFVTDFGALVPFKKFLDTELDHQNLHEVLPFEPTSEHLAHFLAGWIIQNLEPDIPGWLVAVRVCETERSWARFDVEQR